VRAQKGVEGDRVGGGDVRERGVRGGEVLALGVEVDERVGYGEAEREERESDGDGVEGGAEREEAERRGGVEREGDGEVVGEDGQARHEEEQAERGARARLGEAADGAVEERADESGSGGRGVRSEEVGVQRCGSRWRVIGGEHAGDDIEGRHAAGLGRHGVGVVTEGRRREGRERVELSEVFIALELKTSGLGFSCSVLILISGPTLDSSVNSAQRVHFFNSQTFLIFLFRSPSSARNRNCNIQL
jgi:hypothetical protein